MGVRIEPTQPKHMGLEASQNAWRTEQAETWGAGMPSGDRTRAESATQKNHGDAAALCCTRQSARAKMKGSAHAKMKGSAHAKMKGIAHAKAHAPR